MKDVDRAFWMSYLDGILTFRGQPWAHFRHLTQVALSHAAAGIMIQLCKTKLLQSDVEYLGHRISREGVSMIPEQLPRPKTGKKVSTFLGFARYYCVFIPQYTPP